MKEPILLYEGDCAYVVRKSSDCYDIIVFSTNHVTHVLVDTVNDGARAESICRRLNAYPRNTRRFHGLL